MTARRVAAWLAVGFAVGGLAAAALNLRLGRVGVEPRAAAASAQAAEAARDQCVDPPEVFALARSVDQLGQRAETLYVANTLAHFQPPKDLPERFSGEAIERTLRQSVEAAGVKAEIVATDCSEYPCVTTALAASAEDMQKIKDQFFEQPTYAGDIKQLARARGAGPKEYRFGATIYQSTDPRRGELYAALRRRLGVARLGPGSMYPDAHPFPADTVNGRQVQAPQPLRGDIPE